MRKALGQLFGAVALITSMACAHAQPYPAKVVRLVVPVEPGSPTDSFSRLVAQKLSVRWGKQVIVDNRPSMNGLIGTELVARAPADGYTLLAGNSGTHVMNVGLYRKLSYNPVADFTAVTPLVTSPLVLLASPRLSASNVGDAIKQAKKQSINFAIPGATAQLASLMFNKAAGVDIVSVPYKGSSGSETALMAGDAQLMFASVSNALNYRSTGRLRALAVSSLKRSPAMPDIPTLDESGLRGFELDYWIGLFAPAGTPPAIVEQINKAVAEVLSLPDIRDRVNQMGYTSSTASPADFTNYVRQSVDKYSRLSRELGIQQQ